MNEIKEYDELNTEEVELFEKAKEKNILFSFKVPAIVADKKNRNDRYYPEAEVEKGFKNFKTKLTKANIPSQLQHPSYENLELSNVSHVITDVDYNKKEKVGYITCSVLNTTAGNNLKTLMSKEASINLGMSVRGIGNVVSGEVQDWELEGVDVVDAASFGDDVGLDKAKVFESVDLDTILSKLVEKDSSDKIISGDDKLQKGAKDNKMDKLEIKDLKELKAEFPELTKELETTAIEAAKEAAKAEFEEAQAEKDEALKKEILDEINPKLEALEKSNEELTNGVREAANSLLSLPGVLSEEEKEELENSEEADEEKARKAAEEKATNLEKELEAEKEKVSGLEKKEEDRVEAEKAAKAEAELQEKLKAALETELEKDEYKPYANLIRKKLVGEDGKISIEAEDKVEETVAATHKDLSELAVNMVRDKIITSDLTEKGLVENLDKKPEKKTEQEIKEDYRKAKREWGFEGTLEDYKDTVNLK